MRWLKKTTGLEQRVELITKRFKQTFGDDLSSLILFGSAVGGQWHPDRSDLNLLAVFGSDELSILDRAAALKGLFLKHNVSCLWFREVGLPRSADVFPIELLDLKLRRRVLHGDDIIEKVVIYHPDLRLACERIAREKLLALRSNYVLYAGDEAALRSVLIKSAPTWGSGVPSNSLFARSSYFARFSRSCHCRR